ncbi:MAG: hypothetical protein K9N38_03855 [Candidatus Marinimicrobia bacterium]|nr:hypothetical protein [Candidatus Neomarinimicrobiota bacterium]MCF7850559.1 hypothetical protein [Candidatus Neomarinimicrobiota bacterium]
MESPKHSKKLSRHEKFALFSELFRGLSSAYGTYDPASGKYRQVKEPVTEDVIFNHLAEIRPYGFYLLKGDKTRVGVIDVDEDDLQLVQQLYSRSRHYELTPLIEVSKSKGYHLWFVFKGEVLSWKVRAILRLLLEDVGHQEVEIFPKQDEVTPGTYGNFINAPLFGKAVRSGKTVFLDPENNFQQFKDPWELLQSLALHTESQLNDLINLNGLSPRENGNTSPHKHPSPNGYPLPACIRKLLASGTRFNQRIAAFRLAVNLKRIGLPEDLVNTLLLDWRLKNQPNKDKRIITIREIDSQVRCAYQKPYTGIGCEEGVISQYCESSCQIKEKSS